MIRRRWSLLASGVLFAASSAYAQSVISAQSGLIHYVQGRVYVGSDAVNPKAGRFPHMKEGQELRTEAGRAEVLLNPGVFLRVAEDSSFRMIDTRLSATRLEFLSGSILVEAGELDKDSPVTIVFRDASIVLAKNGLYRLDSAPPQIRVFKGEAKVEVNGQQLAVGKGQLLPFGGTLASQKFDWDETDAFDRWSGRRAEHLALANVYAARSLHRSGYSLVSSGWYWNRYFGMYTYVPLSGSYLSPYGYYFWSPSRVNALYAPPPSPSPSRAYGGGGSYDAGRGYTVMAPTSTGHSGTMAAGAPGPTSSGSAPSAPAPRDSGQGGGRSR